jgi:hypothetical protein
MHFWFYFISLFHNSLFLHLPVVDSVAEAEFHLEGIHFANNTLSIPAFRTGGYLPLYRPQSSVVIQIPF